MDMAIGGGLVQAAKTDAYVTTTFKNKNLKTKVINQTEKGPAINWNQEFWIPAQIPIIQPRIVLKVMDEDKVKDEVVASLLFDLKDIVEGNQNN